MLKEDLCKSQGSTILLVEGVNDCHAIMALCEKFKVPETFGIYECGGGTEVLKRLNALLLAPSKPNIIGVVLDTDNPDLATRWNSIKDKLKHYHINFPADPTIDGTIIEADEDLPRLGFWLMPNNQAPGMLEDFCLAMINSQYIKVIDKCLSVAKAGKISNFREVHRSKAKLRVYLALQDEPGLPLGQAITARILLSNNTLAVNFISWLNSLFN
jgi:hypothetical protein